MTDRPHCQDRIACAAISPGKHCRRCWNHAMHRDPEIQARRLASLRERCSAPEYREKISAMVTDRYKDPAAREKTGKAVRAALADPIRRAAWIERAIENGRASWPQTQTPEAAAKRAKALRAHHLAWCPPEFWETNRQLKSSGFPLAERKEIILAQVEHDRQAAEREARDGIARITNAMHAKAEREKEMAY